MVDIVGDSLDLIIHWQGGDHTRLAAKKNRGGQTRWSTDADVIELVKALARQMPDDLIAAVLNRGGKKTGRGNAWTRARVAALRNHHEVVAYREGERTQRGEVTLEEAAAELAVSATTIRRLIACGVLPAHQPCKGAAWIIQRGGPCGPQRE